MSEVVTEICSLNSRSSLREGDKFHYSHDFPMHDGKQYKLETSPLLDSEQSKIKTSICSYFLQGKCKYGGNCKYSHESPRISEKTRMVCRFFLRDVCTKGDSCLFSHVIPSPPKSVIGDSTQDSSSNDRFPYISRFWHSDQDFRSYLKSMVHTQQDSSLGSSTMPLPSSASNPGDCLQTVSLVSTADVQMSQLKNYCMTEADLSKQSHSAIAPGVFHCTVSNITPSNQRNFYTPLMDSPVPEVFPSPFANLPGNICMPHSEFATNSEVVLGNNSYSTSGPKICTSHSDSPLAVKDLSPTRAYTSKPDITRVNHLTSNDPEAVLLNHSEFTSNSGAYNIHNSHFPSASETALGNNFLYPTSDLKICMSDLDSGSVATHSNPSHPMSNFGNVGMPHFGCDAVRKTADINLSYPTSTTEISDSSNLISVSNDLPNSPYTISESGIVPMSHFDSTTDLEPGNSVSKRGFIPYVDFNNKSEKVIAHRSYSASRPRLNRMPQLNLDMVKKTDFVSHSHSASNSIVVRTMSLNDSAMTEVPMHPSNSSDIGTSFPQWHPITVSELFNLPQLKCVPMAHQSLHDSLSKQQSNIRLPLYERTNPEMKFDFKLQNMAVTPEFDKFILESSEDLKCDTISENRSIDKELAEWERLTIERSKGITCEICHENVFEKNDSLEYKFGILLCCIHAFCLPCIKQWSRQLRSNKSKHNRDAHSCPACQKPFDYIVPSKYWTDSEEVKDRLVAGYLKALKGIHCSYFLSGTCRFGSNCRYLHEYPCGKDLQASPSSATSDYHSETGSISNEISDDNPFFVNHPTLKRKLFTI